MTIKNLLHKSAQDTETRQLLINGGIQLIGEKGYDGASISDIANYAGVTKGAVYYHFGSKEDFVLEIIRLRAQKNIANFKKLNKDDISLAEWIENSFSTIIGFPDSAQQQFSLQVMMAGLRPGHERIGRLIAEIHAEWRNLIGVMVKLSDEYRSGQVFAEPDVIAVGVMALIDGLLIHSRLEPDAFSQEAFVEQLAPLLKLWIQNPPTP
jgi:AcrR family transcriptional regulator